MGDLRTSADPGRKFHGWDILIIPIALAGMCRRRVCARAEQVARMLSNASTVRARALDDTKQLEEMRNTCREHGRASQPLAACDS